MRRAFTLIELLLVVAIVALLLAVILPSAASARNRARLIPCLNNARTLGQAATSYFMQYNVLPPGRVNGVGEAAQLDILSTSLQEFADIDAATFSPTPEQIRKGPWVCPLDSAIGYPMLGSTYNYEVSNWRIFSSAPAPYYPRNCSVESLYENYPQLPIFREAIAGLHCSNFYRRVDVYSNGSADLRTPTKDDPRTAHQIPGH